MTFQIALLLVIIVAALVLFAAEWVTPDVVAVGLLVLLSITGLLPAKDTFASFGSETVLLILGLLILTAAMLKTGIVELAGRAIVRRTGERPNLLFIIILLASTLIGAFLPNTASTAMFIPVVMGIARRVKISASKLLMPLSFSSILTSPLTLVSTSSNIIISGLMTRAGMLPMGMFELTPVGVVIMIVGLLYMYFLGPRLISDRFPVQDKPDDEEQDYLTEILVMPDSPWSGRSLSETELGQDLLLETIHVIRNRHRYLNPTPELKLKEGDVILVEGPRDEVLKIKTTAGVNIKADAELADLDDEATSDEISLVEAIILIHSPLIGRTLRGVRFYERFGVRVLAINRRGETLRRKISEVPLRVGDVLLIQGERREVHALEDENMVRVLSSLEGKLPNLRKTPIAVIAFFAPILLGATNIIPFSVAIFLGVLVVFVTRTLSPDEAYQQVEWRAIFVISSMLALGAAMDQTGAAKYLAGQIAHLMAHAHPVWILAGFFLLTVLLCQPMSNQGAAVVVAPIAFQTASQLSLNPRAFAIMIAIATSCTYLTPLEPSNLMVYGPGRYKFIDFSKVGAPLILLIFLISIVLVPLLWPL